MSEPEEIIIVDGSEKPQTRRKKKPKPKIVFPLPPIFEGPLPIRTFDGPDMPEAYQAQIYAKWYYSGPPHVSLFRDTEWTTDDLIGSTWIGWRGVLVTVVGLQADKWGKPELIVQSAGERYGAINCGARLDDHTVYRTAPPYMDIDYTHIYVMHSVRFDTMTTEMQHLWLSYGTQQCIEDAERELTEKDSTKYAKAFALERIASAHKRLHDFEITHGIYPTMGQVQRLLPKPVHRRKAVIPDAQMSMF